MSAGIIKPASLDDIERISEDGDLFGSASSRQNEDPTPDLLASARLVEPKQPKSVHLKIDAEVFQFFKAQGKGHLTRMQNVLKAYVCAQLRP